MTGGGGLLACLACLIVTTTIAKPQECMKPPPWTLDGENPLEKARGNVTLVAFLHTSSHLCHQQAFRMEMLLQDLYEYGIQDLSFFIIISKDSPAVEQFNELQRSLLIPIYQETQNEQVWNIMDGGVNDMFVYDKCGRLTYFIPFPLSNLQETQSVVRAAVLSTYFRSPCGTSCFENENEILSEIEDNQQISTIKLETDAEKTVYYTNGTGVLEDVEDDISPVVVNTTREKNETIVDLYEEDDYDEFDNSSLAELFTENLNSTNKNITEPENPSLLAAFINFIWGDGGSKNSNDKITTEKSLTNTDNEIHFLLNSTNITDGATGTETLLSDNMTSADTDDNTKKYACAGIDENICMDWSKNKMIQAQRCCAIAMQINKERERKGCKNFGRKRCKKLHPLLKCCLKTGMSLEESTNDNIQETM